MNTAFAHDTTDVAASPSRSSRSIGLLAAPTVIPMSPLRSCAESRRGVRDGADVAELTGLLTLPGWPAAARVIVRRERPHPGAQLSLFEERDGWRYTAFVTNTQVALCSG